MRPDELEAFIGELLRQEGRDKCAALWTVTFPLAEAWQVHERRVTFAGVLKKHGGKRKYVPIKFGKSYDTILKAEKALPYKQHALAAMQWLDAGRDSDDTDSGWRDWVPTKVYGPEWIVEVCEAFLNRHEPPSIKEPKQRKATKHEPLVPDLTEDETQAITTKLTNDLILAGHQAKRMIEGLQLKEQEIHSLDERLIDAYARVRQLENLLTVHHIEIPLPTGWFDDDDDPPLITPEQFGPPAMFGPFELYGPPPPVTFISWASHQIDPEGDENSPWITTRWRGSDGLFYRKVNGEMVMTTTADEIALFKQWEKEEAERNRRNREAAQAKKAAEVAKRKTRTRKAAPKKPADNPAMVE